MSLLEHSLVAVDVGSSCVKLGWFPGRGECSGEKPAGNLPIGAAPLPTPEQSLEVQHRDRLPSKWLPEIEAWLDQLDQPGESSCAVASVHLAAGGALEEALGLRSWQRFLRIKSTDVAVEARVAEPPRVGVDRLLGALAVNAMRPPGVAAISVDMGTAITVDLIAADGAFEGGAILAGSQLSLSALHGGTSSLPRLDPLAVSGPPAAVGKSTAQAMAAGAYWGAVGAVNELVSRIAKDCSSEPRLFLTGGAARDFVGEFARAGRPFRYVPHLVLSGICLAANRIATATE